MNYLPTLGDLPGNERNCGTCTHRGAGCPRSLKAYPNGYVMNSVTGEVGGMITRCMNYEGRY
jgi:hypothetical protein